MRFVNKPAYAGFLVFKGLNMLVKSYDLNGIALAWAVSKAFFSDKYAECLIEDNFIHTHSNGVFKYSSLGYDVFCMQEELKISVIHVDDDDPYPIEDGPWSAAVPNSDYGYTGPTALIAICRCYVAHKLGEDIEIPDKLLKA